jgi:hypothetical protein
MTVTLPRAPYSYTASPAPASTPVVHLPDPTRLVVRPTCATNRLMWAYPSCNLNLAAVANRIVVSVETALLMHRKVGLRTIRVLAFDLLAWLGTVVLVRIPHVAMLTPPESRTPLSDMPAERTCGKPTLGSERPTWEDGSLWQVQSTRGANMSMWQPIWHSFVQPWGAGLPQLQAQLW